MQKGKRDYDECPVCGKMISYRIDWKAKIKSFRPHGARPGPCQFVWVNLENGRFRKIVSLSKPTVKSSAKITVKWVLEKKRGK